MLYKIYKKNLKKKPTNISKEQCIITKMSLCQELKVGLTTIFFTMDRSTLKC